MRQHPHRQWEWARFALIHPADNSSVASAIGAYREVLTDEATFSTLTLEGLLDTPDALPRETARLVRARYLGGEGE
jgi:hypothetical protein